MAVKRAPTKAEMRSMEPLAANESGSCLTIDEVCADSRLSRGFVYRLIREKKLIARKIGASTRVLRSDYLAFLRSLPKAGADRAA